MLSVAALAEVVKRPTARIPSKLFFMLLLLDVVKLASSPNRMVSVGPRALLGASQRVFHEILER
jgi:hypothetical protein